MKLIGVMGFSIIIIFIVISTFASDNYWERQEQSASQERENEEIMENIRTNRSEAEEANQEYLDQQEEERKNNYILPAQSEESIYKAKMIVNKKLNGYAEIVSYDGLITYNGQDYYSFYCNEVNAAKAFTIYVNTKDYKVYHEATGFDKEWQ